MGSGTASVDRPARFRDVFASGEFRALYAASTLSWLGDYIARAAITAMVFDLTGSTAAIGGRVCDQFRSVATRRIGTGCRRGAVSVPTGHGLVRRRSNGDHGGHRGG